MSVALSGPLRRLGAVDSVVEVDRFGDEYLRARFSSCLAEQDLLVIVGNGGWEFVGFEPTEFEDLLSLGVMASGSAPGAGTAS